MMGIALAKLRGALFARPAIGAYIIGVYWLFRGKLGSKPKVA
jgi:hypothetical protein